MLLSHVELKVIPLINPTGRRKAEQDPCWRPKANGVDLNRNFDFSFGKGDNDRKGSDTYAGPSAFSEEESRALRDVILDFKPDVYINVHSGIDEIYVAYDSQGAESDNGKRALPIAEAVSRAHCKCNTGSGGRIGGYMAHGTSMDWASEVAGVPYAFTFEVYDGGLTECFQTFNPPTREEYEKVLQTWVPSLTAVIDEVLPRTLHLENPFLPSTRAYPAVQSLLQLDPHTITQERAEHQKSRRDGLPFTRYMTPREIEEFLEANSALAAFEWPLEGAKSVATFGSIQPKKKGTTLSSTVVLVGGRRHNDLLSMLLVAQAAFKVTDMLPDVNMLEDAEDETTAVAGAGAVVPNAVKRRVANLIVVPNVYQTLSAPANLCDETSLSSRDLINGLYADVSIPVGLEVRNDNATQAVVVATETVLDKFKQSPVYTTLQNIFGATMEIRTVPDTAPAPLTVTLSFAMNTIAETDTCGFYSRNWPVTALPTYGIAASDAVVTVLRGLLEFTQDAAVILTPVQPQYGVLGSTIAFARGFKSGPRGQTFTMVAGIGVVCSMLAFAFVAYQRSHNAARRTPTNPKQIV
eukprot:TRINITY_DN6672_c0_g1_i1.p1 TRINITY_DN6672_c0_g1~~TRINITY_DN6672_c0_g1_i1.p1  ORF type:complete len:579 (+),score=119.00 TRINITY_DN6672_c0_g1_i1:441-2177(+)